MANLHDLFRSRFGRYVLVDPRPRAAESPYTFYLPPQAHLRALAPGDEVKLIFQGIPTGRQFEAERMWVDITEVNGTNLKGRLDNVPSDLPQLKVGDLIEFQPFHVIAIQWGTPEKAMRFQDDRPEYVEGCFVHDLILQGKARIGFLSRAQPFAKKEDCPPDSGWRIQADNSQMTPQEHDELAWSYTSLGAVLNIDDSWLPLIGEPVDSAFIRCGSTDRYIPYDFDENP